MIDCRMGLLFCFQNGCLVCDYICLQQVGRGDAKPSSPCREKQAMSLSHEALGCLVCDFDSFGSKELGFCFGLGELGNANNVVVFFFFLMRDALWLNEKSMK